MEKPCEVCGGCGQVGSFRGVSRFMITWEECPECFGIGRIDSKRDRRSSGGNNDDDRDQAGPADRET